MALGKLAHFKWNRRRLYHLSYLSSLILREKEILRERDGRTLYDIDSFIKKDGEVGIA
jgi:hypothetical protein